jgi:hypothetical protein
MHGIRVTLLRKPGTLRISEIAAVSQHRVVWFDPVMTRRRAPSMEAVTEWKSAPERPQFQFMTLCGIKEGTGQFQPQALIRRRLL